MSIPEPALTSVWSRPKKSEVSTSVVTDTTEGITVITTGRKSGRGVAASSTDGNSQSESVWTFEPSDCGGFVVGERDKAQSPTLSINSMTTAVARVYFLDMLAAVIIASAHLPQELYVWTQGCARRHERVQRLDNCESLFL